MTRVAFTADLHVTNHGRYGGALVGGTNERCKLVLETMRAAVKRLKKEGDVDTLVVCGDVFDNAKPAPPLVAGVQDVVSLDGLDWIMVPGNHDRHSMERGDHALAALKPVCDVLEDPEVIELEECQLLCIPFQKGRALDYFERIVSTLHEDSDPDMPRALVFHLGISDGGTPSYLRNADDSIPAKDLLAILKKFEIDAAFAGNWHNHQVFFPKESEHCIVQCGTLAPTGWNNPGLGGYGRLVIWDPLSNTFEAPEIPGPRFVTTTGKSIEQSLIAQAQEKGHKLFVEWKTLPGEEDTEARNTIENWKRRGLIFDGGMAPPDGKREEEEMRQAVDAVAHEVLLSEALAAFVARMPLPEDVDRKTVLAKSLELMKGGRTT